MRQIVACRFQKTDAGRRYFAEAGEGERFLAVPFFRHFVLEPAEPTTHSYASCPHS